MDSQTGCKGAESPSGDCPDQLCIAQNEQGREPTRPTRLIGEGLNLVPHSGVSPMGFIDNQQPAPSVDVVVVKDRIQARPCGP